MQGYGDERVVGRPERLATAGILASAALVASHCLGAIAFLVFGTTMGALGALHALEPYRPCFVAAGLASWGYGFYRLYFRSDLGSARGVCQSLGRARALLWMSLCVLLFAIALPALASRLGG
jgi:mercuric ion transport protein